MRITDSRDQRRNSKYKLVAEFLKKTDFYIVFISPKRINGAKIFLLYVRNSKKIIIKLHVFKLLFV